MSCVVVVVTYIGIDMGLSHQSCRLDRGHLQDDYGWPYAHGAVLAGMVWSIAVIAMIVW